MSARKRIKSNLIHLVISSTMIVMSVLLPVKTIGDETVVASLFFVGGAVLILCLMQLIEDLFLLFLKR